MKFRALQFILVTLCSSVPGYGVWVSAAPLPNVLFILADDLGWSDTTLHDTTLHGTTLHGGRNSTRRLKFNV
ncbi:hypothetical protein SAMN06265222_1011068 [Neorhodopirellula lusitana]|uniref:Sulfatase N-terminal domain-containing protein n=1 Tax=Neorhodopirellula lusitana TaxID=445327 RepID=A0ABY1PT04_9BACT|nr:hypothetical protein [Neorhodopirellula lusitana]SMP44052.1 hypothetical protein SAMN06265222_1011068 [Neorhodopirellula lusitana]